MREFNAGEAIRKSKEWARGNLKCAVWPETIDWPAEIDDRPFKGAESIRGVWNRLSAFLNQLMESAEEKLIIVLYDGTLSVFYAMWLGLKIDIINKCRLCGCPGGVSFLHCEICKRLFTAGEA